MNQETTGSDSGDDRLNQILAAYLEAEQSGQSADREQWLRRHPDIADELQAFFDDHDKMQALAEPVKPQVASDDESVTIAPTVIGSFAADSVGDEPGRLPGFRDQFDNRSANLPPNSDVTSGQIRKKSSPRPGTIIRYFGGYELLEEIARGGMGVVYRARQTSLNRIVALKMILSGQLAGAEEVLRFKTEAEAAANLDHPGIVPIFEIGEHAGQHFFSMGFVEGRSLDDKIKDGPLPPREAAVTAQEETEATFARSNFSWPRRCGTASSFRWHDQRSSGTPPRFMRRGCSRSRRPTHRGTQTCRKRIASCWRSTTV